MFRAGGTTQTGMEGKAGADGRGEDWTDQTRTGLTRIGDAATETGVSARCQAHGA